MCMYENRSECSISPQDSAAQTTQSLGESTMEEANARFIFSTLKKLASQGLSKLKDKVKAKMKNVVSTGLKSVVSLVIPKVFAFLIRQLTGFQDADKATPCLADLQNVFADSSGCSR